MRFVIQSLPSNAVNEIIHHFKEFEPLAFAPDVGHMAVVQQPVQYGRGNDSVPQEVSPLAKALVGSEDYVASFVAGGHQSKEGGGRLPVIGPDAELVLEWATRLWNSSRNGEMFRK